MNYKFWGVVLAIAAYAFYSPQTDLLDTPLKMRLTLMLIQKLQIAALIADITGLGSFLHLQRHIMDLQWYAAADTSELQVIIEDVQFDGVPVRMYKSKYLSNVAAPGLFFIHGGAYIFMEPYVYDELCIRLAASLNAVVVSVQYRLAPEHLFPVAVQDSEKALRYFAAHATKLGVDAARISVAGDSVGGTLAAVLSVRLRDSDDQLPYPVKSQFLIYPLLQSHNYTTVSHQLNSREFGMSREAGFLFMWYLAGQTVPAVLRKAGYENMFEVGNAIFCNNHTLASASIMERVNKILDPAIYDKIYADSDLQRLSELHPSDRIEIPSANTEFSQKEVALAKFLEQYIFNTDYSPLLTPSFANLPAAYILACDRDIFRDDGLLYAERLKAAGVFAHVQRYNCFHGYAAQAPKTPVEDYANFVLTNGLI